MATDPMTAPDLDALARASRWKVHTTGVLDGATWVISNTPDEHGRIMSEETVRDFIALLATARRERRLREARDAIAAIPTREEWIGGQREQYVPVGDVLYIIDAALARPESGGGR